MNSDRIDAEVRIDLWRPGYGCAEVAFQLHDLVPGLFVRQQYRVAHRTSCKPNFPFVDNLGQMPVNTTSNTTDATSLSILMNPLSKLVSDLEKPIDNITHNLLSEPNLSTTASCQAMLSTLSTLRNNHQALKQAHALPRFYKFSKLPLE